MNPGGIERRDFLGALLAVFCGVALPDRERSTIYIKRDPWADLYSSSSKVLEAAYDDLGVVQHVNCRCVIEIPRAKIIPYAPSIGQVVWLR